MSSQTGFCLKESTKVVETGCPLNTEYHTYYPRCYGTGVEQPLVGGTSTVTGLVGECGVRGGMIGGEYGVGRVGLVEPMYVKSEVYPTGVPRLFPYSYCSQEGLEKVFEQVKGLPVEVASQYLIQQHPVLPIYAHPYRGFTVLNGKQVIQEIKKVEVVEPRPVWCVFSGIGNEWRVMGQELMSVEVFRQSIMKCVEVLRPYGINLMEIIFGRQGVVMGERSFNNFVAITAVQIAIVDYLRHIGVHPEGFIGHSIGEIACAYGDYCLTLEEALLTAYHCGKCIEEVQLPVTCMATVGLCWEECQRRIPTGCVVACHNGLNSVTVCGPKSYVQQFVQELIMEGIYARCEENITVPLHTVYMTPVLGQLRTYLEKIICAPKLRSQRWISTSVPEQKWTTEIARFASPEYFVNMLCSPVLFHQCVRYLPTNACVIECGPYVPLRNIMRQTLTQPIVQLIKCDSLYPLEHFFTQIGRMYTEGVHMETVKVFSPFGREQIAYPVSVTGVNGVLPQIVKCEHITVPTWTTPIETGVYGIEKGVQVPVTYKYNVDLIEDAYLTGHQIDGRILYPTTGYLYLIWKSLAQLKGYKTFEQMPINFENVEFHRCTVLPTTTTSRVVETVVVPKRVEFVVRIVPKTGVFELVEGGNVIVSGRVFVPETVGVVVPQQPLITMTGRKFFEQEEIYRELRMRGYEYQGEFQPILKADVEGTCGELLWTGKWVPFLESMLQMNVFGQKRGLLLPTRIRSIKIDPILHLQTPTLRVVRPETIGLVGVTGIERPYGVLPVVFDQLTNTTVCGGIEINGLHTIVTPRLTTFVQQPYNVSYPLVPTYPVTYPVGSQYNETYPTIPTIPSCMENVCFNPIQTYVITGGLTGFGLELAHWMVERGARRIIITSKVGVRSEYQVRKLRILRDEFNAQIQVLPLDVKQEVECLTLIKEAAQMSIENRIGGIFHLSGVWEELPYEIQQQMQQQQVQQQLRKLVDNVKCLGTFNLDKYIRSECVMDESGYFVVFVPVFGPRPTPYTTIEKVCELRRREGRHAMCVQWGFNTELGLTHESLFGGEYETLSMPTNTTTTGLVVIPRRILPCLRVLESLLVKSWEPKDVYTTYIPIEKILNHQEIYGQYPTGQYVVSQPRSLVEYVLGVLGVKDLKTVVCNEKLCLGELGLDSVKCIEIKKIFETVYNLPFTPKEIQEMTIEKIRSIELCQQPTRILPTLPFLPVSGVYPTGVTGLTTGVTGVYPTINGVYPTGVTGVTGVYPTINGVTGVYPTGVTGVTGVTGLTGLTTGVMPRMYTTRKVNYLMPTRVIERLNQIEMSPQQVPVVVIHPIEGHVNMLRSWAKQMKYPVFGVQFTQEAMQYESVEQLAEFYWTQIEKEILRQSASSGVVVVPRIHLCGYSFGSPVAFEMAAKRNGRVASLTFLDGCHSYVNGQLSVFRNRFPMVELVNRIGEVESEILYTFVQQYVPTMITKREFVEELVRLSTLEQRIRYVVRELLTKSQFQFDQFDVELAARSYVNKMLMAIKYQPRQQLVNLPELLLIKSTGPLNLYEQLYGQDYGLGKVFGGKVLVKCVEGDNRSFLEGTNGYQVANILNEYYVRCF